MLDGQVVGLDHSIISLVRSKGDNVAAVPIVGICLCNTYAINLHRAVSPGEDARSEADDEIDNTRPPSRRCSQGRPPL